MSDDWNSYAQDLARMQAHDAKLAREEKERSRARIEALERENARLRDHMDEINAIVDECEYDKKTRKTVDRLRAIAKEALA